MNDLPLRAKHWQLFIFLLAPHLASWYVVDADAETALNFAGIFLLILWLAMLVSALSRIKPNISGYNYNWFLIDVFVVLAAFGYGAVANNPEFYITTTSLYANGTGGILMLYVVFGYLHTHWFPASLLLAKETNRRPDSLQTTGLFLAFFFWPIGIWFVQPRVNKLWDEEQWQQRAVSKLGAKTPVD